MTTTTTEASEAAAAAAAAGAAAAAAAAAGTGPATVRTATPSTPSRLAVLLFTDIVGSTELKSRLGASGYSRLLSRHDELFKHSLAGLPSVEVINDTGDGYLVAFSTASDAVRFALRMQKAVHDERWGPQPLRVSIGVHLGEITDVADASGRPRVIGLAIDLAGRLTALATAGQVLLTRTAFDEARQFLREYPGSADLPLRWVAHGEYLFKGAQEPVEVFEVGGEGIAPLAPPPNSDKAHRSVLAEQEETLGWRPAVGLEVPQRVGWVLEQRLGEGTFGEVWLARDEVTRRRSVFKFCFDLERLQSFKREVTFFRLIRDTLGERRDIAQLYDVRLDEPPYFLESEYAPGGNLIAWASAHRGLAHVALDTRLEIVATICDAVAAAHSVGILHKDIKPGNILVYLDADGNPEPRLSDFGIGLLFDRSQLAARRITECGLTAIPSEESGRTGTYMYLPPEYLAGQPFTTHGDIYALGVLLYQMAIGDLDRPLALGWERAVPDELLREDIAACVDGDPQRRIKSGADLAVRLRSLPERRTRRRDEMRLREHARRRRQLLRVGIAAGIVLVLLSAVATSGFLRERSLRRSAQASERQAQLERANGVVEKATALYLLGSGQSSREAFAQARDQLAHLNESTLAAEAGLYRTYRDYELPINTITGHTEAVMSVAWMPDGVRACSAGLDGTIRLWDVRSGRQLDTFAGHVDAVLCLAVSPDGKFLLSGGKDRTVRLWDLQTRQHYAFPKSIDEVRGVAFSPDGKFALSACQKGADQPSGVVQLWDLERRNLVWTSDLGLKVGFYGVAFSPDGKRCLATCYQYVICGIWIFDARSGKAIQPLKGHTGYVISAVFSPDGSRVLSASADRSLRLWDVRTGEQVKPLYAHSGGVRGVAWADKTGATALSCSMDGLLRLWDLGEGRITRSFAGHGGGGVAAVAVSPDGTLALSGGFDKTVRLWSLKPNRDAPTTRESAAVLALASSADGTLIVSGDRLGGVSLRDAATLKLLRTDVEGNRPIASVAIAGSRLISANDAGAVTVRDLASGKVTRHPPRRPAGEGRFGGADWCRTAVALDGRLAVSSTEDRRNLDLWSLETGKTVRSVGPTSDDITCAAIADDASRAIAGDAGGTIYLWDLATKQCLFRTSVGPGSGPVDCVALSRDGARALSGGHDNLVRLWDLRQNRLMQTFTGHGNFVTGVGFGRDGRTAFSTSMDRNLRLWDIGTGVELDLSAEYGWPAYALALAPAPTGGGDVAFCAAGPSIRSVDLSRTARYLDFQRRLDRMHDGSRAGNDDRDKVDAAALATLGEWYAFRGADDWAIDFLMRARAAGAPVSPLLLARCYWQLDRNADAVREFQLAIPQDRKLEPYLRLCMDAVAHAPATRPTIPVTTAPTTSIAPNDERDAAR